MSLLMDVLSLVTVSLRIGPGTMNEAASTDRCGGGHIQVTTVIPTRSRAQQGAVEGPVLSVH
jgi:hypothetical protein